MIAALIANAPSTPRRRHAWASALLTSHRRWTNGVAPPNVECPPLLLCAATAKSAILVRADGWLELDEKKRAKLKPEEWRRH